MKKYDRYKPSGVAWLGDIPEHWELRRIKYLFRERVQKGFPDESLLAATQSKGVVPKSHYENRTVLAQKDLHLLKLVKKDDFVISLRSFQGGIEKAYYQGIISPAYTIMVPNECVATDFFRYLAKSYRFISLLKTCVTGIREGQNIDYEILKKQYLTFPTKEEQLQIAKFLDWKTSEINKFIRAKKRIIELLKEQIALYLYGRFKANDNDIENWKSSFPRDWTLIKAKRIFKERNIKNQPDKELLAVTQDRGVLLKKTCKQNYVSPSENFENLKLVEDNDFVISLRSFQGGIEYSNFEGLVSPAYTVITLREEYDRIEYIKFFQYLFKTKPFISLLNTIISGIRDGKNIKYSDFAEIPLPIPPASYIRSFLHLLDRYESYKFDFEEYKELIQEYRTRLISDAVTGKIDVRNFDIPMYEEIGTTEDVAEEDNFEEEENDEILEEIEA